MFSSLGCDVRLARQTPSSGRGSWWWVGGSHGQCLNRGTGLDYRSMEQGVGAGERPTPNKYLLWVRPGTGLCNFTHFV